MMKLLIILTKLFIIEIIYCKKVRNEYHKIPNDENGKDLPYYQKTIFSQSFLQLY